MYISLTQSQRLDQVVKSFEVAFRSFIADILISNFPTETDLADALSKISYPSEIIYAKKFQAKIKSISKDISNIHQTARHCQDSIATQTYDNNVPYISELIDLLLLFFNDVFSHANIAKNFSTVEEFHYCSALYHSIRNNLSHPASRPIEESEAAKVVYFVLNLVNQLEEKYFWYENKVKLKQCVTDYQKLIVGFSLKYENLSSIAYSYKQLLCRDTEIKQLYSAIIGDGDRHRLAGSVVLYGYGGVGKTAITTEFLLRVIRDKKDGKYKDIEFILFFSSKDEFLRSSNSTGELYIDEANPQFETLDELKKLICLNLLISTIDEISNFSRGIIVIDNIENIKNSNKVEILSFIKSLPREVQFIITSRVEELCEEKIHVEEFSDPTLGSQFIANLVETEAFNLSLTAIMINKILDVSKGNALIILHILNNLSRELISFDEITKSIETLKSKNSEVIANYMYKNTFDRALSDSQTKGYPVIKVIQIISLYDEKIELYSISKLAEYDISNAETLCNFLLERLVLVKTGEYYELNEFAKRFVFIKLLPDKINLGIIKDKIRTHKTRMKDKLQLLEATLANKNSLKRIVEEWQPRNYIDKIVIAELFALYFEADLYAKKKNRREYERCCNEFNEHRVVTNHPYVAFQNARLLKLQISNFEPVTPEVLKQIEASYEEAIESIEFDYRYLMNTPAHSSLQMLFGIFLTTEMNDYSRAIRYLEDSISTSDNHVNKAWFLCRNYLALSYFAICENSKAIAYDRQLTLLCKTVVGKTSFANACQFDIGRFRRKFSKYI